MTTVLVVVLGVSLALTYRTLADAARDTAAVRLSRAAHQLASTFETGVSQRAGLLRRVAADSAIHRVLRATTLTPNATAEARAALARLAVPTDSAVPIELWTDDGRRLIRLNEDSVRRSGTGELADLSPTAKALGTGIVRSDSVRIGAFYDAGGRVHFGISTPVYDGPRRLGYIAELRRVTVQPSGEQALKELMGEDVTGRYRNVSGTFWSTMAGTPVAPLTAGGASMRDSVVEASRPGVGALFATEAAIRGTPWAIVLELPTAGVLARTRGTMIRLGMLSLLLVGVGAVVSWIISKRITKPLATLSGAAEALARGDVTRYVDDSGGDELAQLARTFNYMRDEITSTRTELEAHVEEAQSATEELEQANEQLHHAMETAATANRAKGDFLAVMSHELRTPLNAIGGYVELLQLGVHGPLTEPQRDALGRVARSQQRLLALINDVLNFARLDAGHVEYNWSDFSLDAALAALEPLLALQMRAKRLTYTYAACDPSLSVHADHDRLQQVVLNLLSNAVKFTPEGGGIVVYCDASVDPDAVFVHVRDSGQGIPPDRLRTIFEPFVQVDRSLNRPHEGIGLGLSISRELARGMGGDLTVQSELGKGSVFTVKVCRSHPGSLSDGHVSWTAQSSEEATTRWSTHASRQTAPFSLNHGEHGEH
jgi:signal transduction histidine kinase